MQGEVVVTQDKTICAQSLSRATTANFSSIKLNFELKHSAEGKTRFSTYILIAKMLSSRPMCGALYRERLVNLAGEEVLAFLKTIWLLQRVAIVLHTGHQKGDSPETRGNKSSLLGHLGSGPGTSGTSPSLGSPAEALFTGLPGKKLTGQDKNWSNRINKDDR